MAKDILGREIDPNTSAGAYRKMVDNTNVMQAAGKGARTVADSAGQAMRNMGSLVNQSPKLVGAPAAGLANLAATAGANFMTGFTGQKYVPNTYEGKTLTQLFGSGQPPATVAPSTPAVAALPSIKPNAPSTYVPGTGLPSADQVASDRTRATLAQRVSDEATGISAGNPLQVNVSRQANGNLSFSGIGGGQGVSYTGQPNWTSQRGGAGQGGYVMPSVASGGNSGFNLGDQNQRMAAALQGIRSIDAQKQRADLVDRIASGSGGAIGVAQNKMALAGLNDWLNTDSRNSTTLGAAGMAAETQRRGQDIAAQTSAARNMTTLAGYKTQAETAKADQELRKEQIGMAHDLAQQKLAAGKPLSLQEKIAVNLYAGRDTAGKPFKSAADEQRATERFATLFKNTSLADQMMYQQMQAPQDN